jgi:hypothetical protein
MPTIKEYKEACKNHQFSLVRVCRLPGLSSNLSWVPVPVILPHVPLQPRFLCVIRICHHSQYCDFTIFLLVQ